MFQQNRTQTRSLKRRAEAAGFPPLAAPLHFPAFSAFLHVCAWVSVRMKSESFRNTCSNVNPKMFSSEFWDKSLKFLTFSWRKRILFLWFWFLEILNFISVFWLFSTDFFSFWFQIWEMYSNKLKLFILFFYFRSESCQNNSLDHVEGSILGHTEDVWNRH